ncbi:hypothetical protein ABFT23_07615 [Nocardioides sp. C4-1]|uniref:hypothetical protein n=1 Tax=Nocardioides sp. C4-1 TaxID=3151851 RepID=UPI0032633138
MPSWVRPVVLASAVAGVIGVVAFGNDASDRTDPTPAQQQRREAVSDAELCAALGAVSTEQDAHLSAPGPRSTSGLKSATAEVADLATRATLDDDVRLGLGLAVERIDGLGDVVTAQEMLEADDDAALKQDRHGDAFAAWVGAACNDGVIPARYLVPRVTGAEAAGSGR